MRGSLKTCSKLPAGDRDHPEEGGQGQPHRLLPLRGTPSRFFQMPKTQAGKTTQPGRKKTRGGPDHNQTYSSKCLLAFARVLMPCGGWAAATTSLLRVYAYGSDDAEAKGGFLGTYGSGAVYPTFEAACSSGCVCSAAHLTRRVKHMHTQTTSHQQGRQITSTSSGM